MTGENHILDTPIGSDVSIQRVQKLLYDRLPWENVKIYGRAVKMPMPEDRTRLVPMVRKSNGEHADPLRDDLYNANIFFLLGDRANNAGDGVLYKVECKIIFMLNLKNVYPNFTGVADEKAHKDVINVLKAQRNFVPTSIGTGFKECFADLDTNNIKFTDVQPNHVFCITGQLSYNISC